MEDTEKLINEIVAFIKDNIILYYLNSDECFLKLKDYCKEEHNYIHTPYDILLELTLEVFDDLKDVIWLYDFRDIE